MNLFLAALILLQVAQGVYRVSHMIDRHPVQIAGHPKWVTLYIQWKALYMCTYRGTPYTYSGTPCTYKQQSFYLNMKTIQNLEQLCTMNIRSHHYYDFYKIPKLNSCKYAKYYIKGTIPNLRVIWGPFFLLLKICKNNVSFLFSP